MNTGRTRFKKGFIPWNKGLTKETDIRINRISKSLIGNKNPAKRLEVREKMRLSHTGLKVGPCSEERKRKISEANKGENHWMWNGKVKEKLYPLGWTRTFKEQIRFRDGYKCQLCGIPECECIRKLHVHHIDYDKMNINVDNLISLCISCHGKTNSKKRENWTNYFKRNDRINKSENGKENNGGN